MVEYFVSEIPGNEQNTEYIKDRQNIRESFHSTCVSIIYIKVKIAELWYAIESKSIEKSLFFSSLHFLCQTFNMSVLEKIIHTHTHIYMCVCAHTRIRTQY